jgi:hypothetical protein
LEFGRAEEDVIRFIDLPIGPQLGQEIGRERYVTFAFPFAHEFEGHALGVDILKAEKTEFLKPHARGIEGHENRRVSVR